MIPITRPSVLLCRRVVNHTSFVRHAQLPQVDPRLTPLKKYVFSSYFEFLKNYDVKLEAKFPAAIRIYRIFKEGFQDFYQDFKGLMIVRKKLRRNYHELGCLSRQELELNMRMPGDMYRVAPVLLISALPFANYVVFPLAYLFPRQLLCRHFWTLQQKIQYSVLDQKRRLRYYKPVFRALQSKVSSLKGHQTHNLWRQCIAQLGSGLHPGSIKVANVQHLFGNGQVYDLKNLPSSHLRVLLKMHDMHTGWRRRKRLLERAKMIYYMDLAIMREGGVEAMSQEDVRTACFIRGLNPTNMNADETVRWLKEWIKLSKGLKDESWSFILHLPILTAYNHPSNWVLIH
uniref:LETM1 domain-containing protein 1 n=2 Tax=Lygus hesperus TaxID=30085 RepID=A0A0A9XR60_LYGHE